MRVTVVGAGVIGLTTALTLEERGHDVRVVAAATGAATTSSVAAAIWFPYECGPAAKVIPWGERTRTWLEGLADTHAAGIDVLTGYEITVDEGASPADPWWTAGMTVARAPAPVAEAPMSWRYTAPRIDPGWFLAWLAGRLRAPIERRAVTELDAEPGDAVVNCAGLGARALAGDAAVGPLFGQVVLVERGGLDPAVTLTDMRDPERMFYLIPRRDEVVLGGVAIPWPPGAPATPDPAISARILAQARSLGLSVGAVREVRTGLRPARPEVRLERDPAHPRILHNYGHGGAGFTLCRGCAEEVAALLEAGPP